MGILNAVDTAAADTAPFMVTDGAAANAMLSPVVPCTTEPCPVPQHRIQGALVAAAALGARSVSLWDVHGRLLATAGAPGAVPGLARNVTRTGAAATPMAVAPVRVGEHLMATVQVIDDVATAEVLHLIAQTTAAWVATLWEDAGEIDNLAREIVHAYEELHLLYELGESLARQFDGAGAADFVLEKIVGALGASFAELQLTDGTVRTYMRDNTL